MGRLLDTLRKKKQAALRAADVERAIAPDEGADPHTPGNPIRNLPHPRGPLNPHELAAKVTDLEARIAALELNN